MRDENAENNEGHGLNSRANLERTAAAMERVAEHYAGYARSRAKSEVRLDWLVNEARAVAAWASAEAMRFAGSRLK